MSGIRELWNALTRWLGTPTAGAARDATPRKAHYCPQCQRWVPASEAANHDSCQLCDDDDDGDGIDDELE